MTSAQGLYDIVISFDTTGSMNACIKNVKTGMNDMMRKLKNDIPGIKLGVIAHGDYDTGCTYIIKYEDLTDDVQKLCMFVQLAKRTAPQQSAQNPDEAYELSLQYSRRKISWRNNSNRILVMIGDCRPHERHYFLNKKHIDWTEEIVKLREMDVKIYAVQCENRKYADSFYQKIASTTFGHHVTLLDFKKIIEVLISICYREAGLNMTATSISEPTTFQIASTETPDRHNSNELAGDGIEEKDDGEAICYGDDDDNTGMRCCLCSVAKPVNEFPQEPLTDECRHFYGTCLRCVVKYVKEHSQCPQEGCGVHVDPSCFQMKLFEAILENMFLDYEKVLENSRQCIRQKLGDVITVSALNGDSVMIPYRANLTITDIKDAVKKELGIEVSQQKILHRDKGLKVKKASGEAFTLHDYGIESNENLNLIIPLYCIPDDLDHVVFDLSWGFPKDGPDFLDASCFAFEGNEFMQVIDWNHPTNEYYLKGSVMHSTRNEMRAGSRIGHQTIHVYLKRLPLNIDHLYFTLSSWRSPNLAAFCKPTLQFYEYSSSAVDLCSTSFGHALNSQAVIMCYVVRSGRQWQIFECGSGGCVDGNSKRYNPIRKKIVELIDNE